MATMRDDLRQQQRLQRLLDVFVEACFQRPRPVLRHVAVQPALDEARSGTHRPDLSLPAHEGVLTELPLLPRTTDASTTALYIQSVVSGEKPAPGPLTSQVECAVRLLASLRQGAGASELIA